MATTNYAADGDTLDAVAKPYWRARALESLGTCLRRQVDATNRNPDPECRARLQRTWEGAKRDKWLFPVHDPDMLNLLPDTEAQAWRTFWQHVDAALDDAGFPVNPFAR
jgi:hypothetical protein